MVFISKHAVGQVLNVYTCMYYGSINICGYQRLIVSKDLIKMPV